MRVWIDGECLRGEKKPRLDAVDVQEQKRRFCLIKIREISFVCDYVLKNPYETTHPAGPSKGLEDITGTAGESQNGDRER